MYIYLAKKSILTLTKKKIKFSAVDLLIIYPFLSHDNELCEIMGRDNPSFKVHCSLLFVNPRFLSTPLRTIQRSVINNLSPLRPASNNYFRMSVRRSIANTRNISLQGNERENVACCSIYKNK